jgi:hypothetical protein
MRSSRWRPRSRLFILKARNREDAAQRLQRFIHWVLSFEETFHSIFAVLALNVHHPVPICNFLFRIYIFLNLCIYLQITIRDLLTSEIILTLNLFNKNYELQNM